VKRMSKGPVRSIQLRAVVASPAVTLALVAAVALALTPLGPSEGVALAATTDPTATSTPMATTPPTTNPATPPATPPATDPATPPATAATSTTLPGTVASAAPGVGVSPGAAFGDHHVLARIEGPKLQASYLTVDAAVSDASQFQTFRVRFRLHNAGTVPITKTPQLEFRTETGTSGFVVVPEKPMPGIPLHLDREWVPSLGLGGGTMQGPLGADIAVADFRIGKEGGLAVIGHRSMGTNPDRALTLPSTSYTEEEFTVTLSMDAKYLTGYELRITNAGTPLTGTDVATIRLGAPPAVRLTPGQHQGVAVGAPKATAAPGVVK
jgi:hypothetical protein